MDNEEKLRKVMELVNAAREVYDMQPLVDLPLGEMGEPEYCSLAIALPMFGRISGCWLTCDTEDHALRLGAAWAVPLIADHGVEFPDCFTWFIEEFDNGRLPQYALPDPEEEGPEEEPEEGDEGEEEAG